MSDPDVSAEDWRRRMQTAAEKHLRQLIRATIHLDSAKPGGHPTPYCSCIPCEVRETITGAWPIIQQMIADAVERADTDDDPDPVCLNPKAVDGTAAPCGTCPACRRVEL